MGEDINPKKKSIQKHFYTISNNNNNNNNNN